jgi:hypothetical protein
MATLSWSGQAGHAQRLDAVGGAASSGARSGGGVAWRAQFSTRTPTQQSKLTVASLSINPWSRGLDLPLQIDSIS